MKRFIIGLLTSLLALTALTLTAPPASAIARYQTVEYGRLHPNITVGKGWFIRLTDTNGCPTAKLIFQTDGNLVGYRYPCVGTATQVVWSSNTVRPAGTSMTLVFQTDGNWVIYQAGRGAQWASGTNYGANFTYNMDTDSDGLTAIWQWDPNYGASGGWRLRFHRG